MERPSREPGMQLSPNQRELPFAGPVWSQLLPSGVLAELWVALRYGQRMFPSDSARFCCRHIRHKTEQDTFREGGRRWFLHRVAVSMDCQMSRGCFPSAFRPRCDHLSVIPGEGLAALMPGGLHTAPCRGGFTTSMHEDQNQISSPAGLHGLHY